MTGQIQRIKDKLLLAKKADKKLKVFGADRHKYLIHRPLGKEALEAFERQYQIGLPDCYKSFILEVGNGGTSHLDSAVGPFYGIYPLGKNVDELIHYNTEKYLKGDCIIYPEMSDDYWKTLRKEVDSDDIAGEHYEKEIGKIYGGILPIGSQGCSYLHGIVINGQYKGRVVNLDIDGQKPKFTFEHNFLDWYERWLDEVISGALIKDGPSWFGYSMGGSDKELLRSFSESESAAKKADYLDGILIKPEIEAGAIPLIEAEFLKNTGALKTTLLQILTKFDYERAKPYLIQTASVDLLAVFQFIFWYAKEKSSEWVSLIAQYIEMIDDAETFRFCTYILTAANVDFADMVIPFVRNKSESIRIAAYYTLGQAKNKQDHLDAFIEGLNSDSNRVIHATLQAMDGLVDPKLLVHYKRIAEKFPEEKDYILSNLNHRLRDYGLDNRTILYGEKPRREQKKWFQVWK